MSERLLVHNQDIIIRGTSCKIRDIALKLTPVIETVWLEGQEDVHMCGCVSSDPYQLISAKDCCVV